MVAGCWRDAGGRAGGDRLAVGGAGCRCCCFAFGAGAGVGAAAGRIGRIAAAGIRLTSGGPIVSDGCGRKSCSGRMGWWIWSFHRSRMCRCHTSTDESNSTRGTRCAWALQHRGNVCDGVVHIASCIGRFLLGEALGVPRCRTCFVGSILQPCSCAVRDRWPGISSWYSYCCYSSCPVDCHC